MKRLLLLATAGLATALLVAHEAPRAVPASTHRRPDLVLVTVDTLRADALGFAGNRLSATPVLDRLAAAGRVFPRAHAHNVVTLPSHTNILTGLYPFQHGVRDNSGFRLEAGIPTLAALLKQAGYATGAFVGAFPLDSQFGLGRGFDVYDDRTSRGREGESFLFAERRGDEVVAAALDWWRREEGQPRFLWVHLFDPHAPYAPPEPFASRFAGNLYLGEVAAADSFLAPLFAAFAVGRAEPPFVVFTSDHGEALGDHGELTHGLFAYESTLHVPLVLWGAGVTPGRDGRSARHVDILPTFLARAGLPPPAAAPGHELPGRSLLAPASPESSERSYFEALSATFNRRWAPLRGILQGRRKWIDLPLPELYDLDRDPGEQNNQMARVAAAGPRAIPAIPALPRESAWPPARGEVPAEDAARLASLGYITGGGGGPLPHYGPEDDPKNLIELDRKLHAVVEESAAGHWEAAIRLAREAVAERPGMPLGQQFLVQALLEAGHTEEALTVLSAARRDGVTSEALERQLGLTLGQLGRFGEALDVLRPLAAGGSPAAAGALATVLSAAGRQDEAAGVARRLVAADPGNAHAHQQLGLIEVRRRHWQAAREQLAAAVAANPRLVVAWNNLGVALYELHHPDAALAAWRRALELDPNLWDTLWNLGTKAAERGRNGEARAALERFARGAPASRYAEQTRAAHQFLATLRAGR